MKKIYIIILFLGILNFMIPYMQSTGWFPYGYQGDGEHYQIDGNGFIQTSEGVFEEVSGYSFSTISSFDLDTFITIGGAIVFGVALAKAFHSAAPLAVTLFLAIFINLYRNFLFKYRRFHL